jgi:hypothetical protein
LQYNLEDEIERLEDTIQKIGDRLYALNKVGLGIDGMMKALREKILCLQNMIELAEKKCKLTKDSILLTPSTACYPDQLDNLDRMLSSCFERLHSLEPLLLLKTVWSI